MPLDVKGSDARYVHGRLIYAVSGIVYAVPFDAQTRKATGSNFVVQAGVSRAGGSVTGAANFGVSDDRIVSLRSGPADAVSAPMELSLIDPQGSQQDTNGRAPGKLNFPPSLTTLSAPRPRRANRVRKRPRQGMDHPDVPPPAGEGLRAAADAAWHPTTGIQPGTATANASRFSPIEGSDAIWWQSPTAPAAQRLTSPNTGESHIPESWRGKRSSTTAPGKTAKPRSGACGKTGGRKRGGSARRFDRSDGRCLFPERKAGRVHQGRARRDRNLCGGVPFHRTGVHSADGGRSPKHPQWSTIGESLYYNRGLAISSQSGSRRTPELEAREAGTLWSTIHSDWGRPAHVRRTT